MKQITEKQKIVLICVIGIAIFVIDQLKSKKNTIYSKSQSKWSSTYNIEVARVLAENGTKDCGEFKTLYISHGQYMVACTANGSAWTQRIVDVTNDTVSTPAPLSVDAGELQ